MRQLGLLILVGLGALAIAGGSAASPGTERGYAIGATEDRPLGEDDGGASMYDQMLAYGLTEIRMSAYYDGATPTVIPQRAALARAIPPAVQRGIRVLLALIPRHGTDVTADPSGVANFAAFAALVARTFPQVTDFIVGNEPNLGRFWAPTFYPDGTIAAAATYEAMLAATYDALKAVDPGINVIGFALAERGDDRPGSARRTISPVRFLDAVGKVYRASGRKAPLADSVALHPYPNVDTDPPERGFAWPNVGAVNLARGQQAFWDAFHGTGQPTFEEGAPARRPAGVGRPVRWYLDESGWQTTTEGLPGYTGSENVPTVDEDTQARYFAAMLGRLACDRHVAALHTFKWVDEVDRDRYQTGAVRADGTVKPAAAAIRQALARGCTAEIPAWSHTTGVAGARVDFRPRADYLLFVHAHEDATFTATARPKRRGRTLAVTGTVDTGRGRGVRLPGIRNDERSNYRLTVTVGAVVNPERTATFGT